MLGNVKSQKMSGSSLKNHFHDIETYEAYVLRKRKM